MLRREIRHHTTYHPSNGLKIFQTRLQTPKPIMKQLYPAIAPEIIPKILPKNCSQTVPEIVLRQHDTLTRVGY